MLPKAVVVHVSAVVELLLGTDQGNSVHGRLRGTRPHAPAQIDAEVLSCLARLSGSPGLPAAVADQAVARLAVMPLVRHETADLLPAAWAQRAALGPADMLYVALADRLHAPLVTTDPRLADTYPRAEVIAR